MGDQQNITVELDDVTRVAGNLAQLADDIEKVLGSIYSTISEVADGAINGTAPTSLIDTYDQINEKLSTYVPTLQTLSENLTTSGDIFNTIDQDASNAASSSQE